jgi:thymidine phosphorylase
MADLNASDTARELISDFLNKASENSMENLVSFCRKQELNESEILFLAKGLASSGEQLQFSESKDICDIASTGGPSSLSTLLCPLYLKALGMQVMKLGVPGRPAGGIDILAQIKGYEYNPSTQDLQHWFRITGYVHFLAKDSFTPLDGLLFTFRKKNNAIEIPSLAIASLISKKIAVSVSRVGLDIRVSSFGNFGKTWEEATDNGQKFNRVARLAGLYSKCFLTDGSEPQQPFIGRGEALLALQKIFENNINAHLRKHLTQCYCMAVSLVASETREEICIDKISRYFSENVVMQHGSIDSFYEIAETVQKEHKFQICATRSGVLIIDVEKIRYSILTIQSKFSVAFPDPAGVILNVESNMLVNKNDLLCTYRCTANFEEEFANSIKQAFIISDAVVSNNLKEVI